MLKRTKISLMLGLMFASAGSLSHAEDSQLNIWQGEGELGFIITDGNTETQSLNTKFSLTKEQEKWRNNFRIEALNTSENDNTSAEKYLASVKTDYKFTSADFVFTALSYEDDRFNASGFDYQIAFALGYGRTIMENDLHSLTAEIGPGYRYSKIKATGLNEKEGIIRSGASYRLNLSETAQFQQDLNIDLGEEEVITKSVTAVKAQVVGELAMKVSLTLRHTDEALPGNESVDRESALTLVYSF